MLGDVALRIPGLAPFPVPRLPVLRPAQWQKIISWGQENHYYFLGPFGLAHQIGRVFFLEASECTSSAMTALAGDRAGRPMRPGWAEAARQLSHGRMCMTLDWSGDRARGGERGRERGGRVRVRTEERE